MNWRNYLAQKHAQKEKKPTMWWNSPKVKSLRSKYYGMTYGEVGNQIRSDVGERGKKIEDLLKRL